MPAYRKIAGAWQEMTAIHTKVAGTWQTVQNGYVKVSGVWQPFFSARTFGLAEGDQYHESAFAAEVTYSLNSNGAPWTLPTETGIGAGYEGRATYNSGDTMTTGIMGTWLSLSSNRSWTLSNNVYDTTKSGNFTFEVRITSGAVVASETINMTAVVLP